MTLYIAIWGAVLGTVTFAWNIWKWRQENPHIVATVEALRSSWSEANFAGIRLTIRNRGGKKTTVEEIYFYRRLLWFEYGFSSVLPRLFKEIPWQQNAGVSNPETVKLPVILDVNGVWEGFVSLQLNDPDNEKELRQIDRNRELEKMLQSEQLRYSIICSHTSRRLRGLVKGEADTLKE